MSVGTSRKGDTFSRKNNVLDVSTSDEIANKLGSGQSVVIDVKTAFKTMRGESGLCEACAAVTGYRTTCPRN
jgi:hypothetical protein